MSLTHFMCLRSAFTLTPVYLLIGAVPQLTDCVAVITATQASLSISETADLGFSHRS